MSSFAVCREPKFANLVFDLARSDPTLPPPHRLGGASLNNEFLARACQQWQERLRRGEFTHENQHKYRTELDMMRRRLDPWKVGYWLAWEMDGALGYWWMDGEGEAHFRLALGDGGSCPASGMQN